MAFPPPITTTTTTPVRHTVHIERRPKPQKPQIVKIKGIEYEVTVTSADGRKLVGSEEMMKIVQNMGTAFAKKNRGFTEADFDIVEKSHGLSLDILTVDPGGRRSCSSKLPPVTAKSYKYENISVNKKTPKQKEIIKIFRENFDAPSRTSATHTRKPDDDGKGKDKDDSSIESSSVSHSKTSGSDDSTSTSESVSESKKKKRSKKRKKADSTSSSSTSTSEDSKKKKRKRKAESSSETSTATSTSTSSSNSDFDATSSGSGSD